MVSVFSTDIFERRQVSVAALAGHDEILPSRWATSDKVCVLRHRAESRVTVASANPENEILASQSNFLQRSFPPLSLSGSSNSR